MKTNQTLSFKVQLATILLAGFWLSACAKMDFKDAASSSSSGDVTGAGLDRGPASDPGTNPVGGDGNGGGGGTNPPSMPPVGDGSGAGGDSSPPGIPPVGGDGKCVPRVADITRPTKILFLVDTTGSNAYTSDIYDGSVLIGQAPATDASKSFRYNSISNFMRQYSAKTNFKWGLISFAKTASNSGAQGLLNSGNSQNPIFGTSAAALSALEMFKNTVRDEGETHYTPLMALAAKAIQSDADFSNTQTQYFVLLVSDGMPNDPLVTSYNSARITELTGLAADRIKVSSVFYTSLVTSPILDRTRIYLKDLVRRAQGIYAEVTGTNANIPAFNFNDIIPGTPGDPNCPSM